MAHAVNHLRPPPGMRLAPLVRGLGGSVRTITFLALTILTALVSSAFLPWEAAFLLTGGLAALYAMTCCNRNDREDERDPVQRALDQRLDQRVRLVAVGGHGYQLMPDPAPPPVVVVHQQPVPVYAPPRAPADAPRVPVGHDYAAERREDQLGHVVVDDFARREREIRAAQDILAAIPPAEPPPHLPPVRQDVRAAMLAAANQHIDAARPAAPRAAHVLVGRSGAPLRGTATMDLAPPPAPPAPANAPRVRVEHEPARAAPPYVPPQARVNPAPPPAPVAQPAASGTGRIPVGRG